jgi:hypothetical protein
MIINCIRQTKSESKTYIRNLSLTVEAENMESNNNVAAKYFQGKVTIDFKFGTYSYFIKHTN